MSQPVLVRDVVAAMEVRYRPDWAEDWDAVGLVCGDPSVAVTKIHFAVDATPAVVDEAIASGAQMLITHHQSQVPNTREALERLPGVGRKTANVILNTAFGEPTIAVDTHLFRLGNRIKLATGKTVLEVEHKYLKTIPAEFMQDAHHLLILHGRYTCIARKPKCAACCIEDLCEYQAKEYNVVNN